MLSTNKYGKYGDKMRKKKPDAAINSNKNRQLFKLGIQGIIYQINQWKTERYIICKKKDRQKRTNYTFYLIYLKIRFCINLNNFQYRHIHIIVEKLELSDNLYIYIVASFAKI